MKTRRGWLIQRGKKGTYYAVWEVRGHRFMRSTGQTNRKDAERELARIMQPLLVEDDIRTLETVKARIEGGKAELARLDDERNPPLTIGAAWPAFIASHNRPDTGQATLAVYELTWGRFWRWMQDNHPETKVMRDVTPEIAGQFADWLTGEGRSPNTFNKYMNLLALVFRTLKDKARLTMNPWETIQRKRLVTHGRRELTIDELRKVCDAAQGDLRLLLALGVYTGLRLGDCSTLRWGEVDLVRGIIRRIPNKVRRRNNARPVILPIHPTLHTMLSHIPEQDRREYVLPRIAADYAHHESYVTDRVQALFESCGILTRRAVEGRRLAQVEVGFHSLRHSFVSMLAERSVPQSVTQSLVGHSTPAMTRHYTHTGEAATQAAIAALPPLDATPTQVQPPAHSPRMVDAEAIRAGLEGMTARNWKAKREQLLATVQH